MKAPWWLKALALALLCCCCGGCAHSSEKQAEAHEAVNATKTAKASGSFAEKVEAGPGRTVIYKFGPAEEHAGAEGPTSGSISAARDPLSPTTQKASLSVASGSGHAREDNLPQHGPLVEMDVIDTGPTSTTIAARATEATREAVQATREVKTDQRSKWSALVPWWLWLVGLVALGGAIWLARSRLRMLVGL